MKNDSRRMLRQRATRAESMLWQLVRDRRFDGLKVRRQYAVAGFIADFYFPEAALSIELDGPHHDERREADLHRDTMLSAHGINTVRIKSHEIEANPRAALARIRQAITATYHPPPSLDTAALRYPPHPPSPTVATHDRPLRCNAMERGRGEVTPPPHV